MWDWWEKGCWRQGRGSGREREGVMGAAVGGGERAEGGGRGRRKGEVGATRVGWDGSGSQRREHSARTGIPPHAKARAG